MGRLTNQKSAWFAGSIYGCLAHMGKTKLLVISTSFRHPPSPDRFRIALILDAPLGRDSQRGSAREQSEEIDIAGGVFTEASAVYIRKKKRSL